MRCDEGLRSLANRSLPVKQGAMRRDPVLRSHPQKVGSAAEALRGRLQPSSRSKRDLFAEEEE